jgi:histidine ammonia-lyase
MLRLKIILINQVVVREMRMSVTMMMACLLSAVILCLLGVTPAFAAEREVIALTGKDLTLDDVVKIAENRADIVISPEGMQRIEAARKVIQHYVDDKIPAYGINTMYGQDFGVTLPQAEIKRINRLNLFQEATNLDDGSQPYLEPGIVRAAWALMVNSYATGFPGASPGLAEKLVERVNANRIPGNIEYGGSMGDADLIMNAKLAVSLYDDPDFEVGAGDATNLLTSNFLTIAGAVVVAKRSDRLLARAKVSLALAMEGYRANPSPISESAMKAATLASKRKIQSEMQFLLRGSKLWEKGGPRRLQDFLSMRTSADLLAAVEVTLDHFKKTLLVYCNTFQASPMVDVEEGRILSVTEYDTTQLTLDLDHFRQSLGLMAIATNSRALKVMSRPFTDLPSGLASDDPTKFDGLYTRNITYLMTSLSRDAVQYSKQVTGMTVSFIAEGDEDYSVPFPQSAWLAKSLVDRLEKIVTIEALIGSFALERRLQSGELTDKDIPAPLRIVQREIIKRSPMQISADEQYSLAPLLKYFIEEYDPPKEITHVMSDE